MFHLSYTVLVQVPEIYCASWRSIRLLLHAFLPATLLVSLLALSIVPGAMSCVFTCSRKFRGIVAAVITATGFVDGFMCILMGVDLNMNMGSRSWGH